VKIGVRNNPHLELTLQSIKASGKDRIVSYYDTGADFWLCWGWPTAEQMARDLPASARERIIAVDAHPFALEFGVHTGERIFQLGNWGAMANYPEGLKHVAPIKSRAIQHGPTLVLGQVRSTEQLRLGLIDTWYTPGCDQWIRSELAKPWRKFREHPREWVRLHSGKEQPTLAEDLRGCAAVLGWNSTALVHARRLGYPVTGVEEHAWCRLPDERLEALRVTPEDLRSGAAWLKYREFLGASQHDIRRAGGTAR
jgi:hypothetical protein